MTRKILIITGIVLCLLNTGCSLFPKNKNVVWFYTYSELGPTNDYISEPNKKLTDYNLNPSNFLCLLKDGNYAINFGHYEFGKWIFKDSVLSLDITGEKRTYIIVSRKEKEMLIKVPGAGSRSSIWHFEQSEVPNPEASDNPFAPENNVWRIKAYKKETDKEITERLRNHFSYWEKYFKWGLDAKINYLDVRSLPGPLKIYGNGFVLLDFEKWPEEWTSLFYDEEDAKKAYNKLSEFFEHKHIAWAHTDNKYKMFMSAFQQLEQQL